MNGRIALQLLLFVGVLMTSLTLFAAPHIVASPDDYVLKSDLRLSTGQILPAGTRWYQPPDIARLKREVTAGSYKGDISRARQVIFGYDLVYNTWNTVGEGRKDGKPPLGEGRMMSCTNCHAQAGTVPYAWPFFRTLTFYGLREEGAAGVPFGGLGYVRDARSRASDCGRECGGTIIIDAGSPEMDALVAWMRAVRDGIYPGEGLLVPEFRTSTDVGKIPGATIPLFDSFLDMKADPSAGARIFGQHCASCHGREGTGLWGGPEGFIYPPLAGEGSFSHAGGPLMIPIGAAFINRNMPLTQPGSLSPQQSIDVMAYVSTLPRASVWWQTYYFRHDPCSRPPFLPLHIGAVPMGFPFPSVQVQFGPWRPIAEWLASDECRAKNPPGAPQLDHDFDARQSQ